jgi:NAD(P)H-flavin reductase
MLDVLSLPRPDATIHFTRVKICEGTIETHQQLTPDTFELVIKITSKTGLGHPNAGQFAVLVFPGINRGRPYSFARNPKATKDEGEEYTFFIRAVPDGEVSNWLMEGDKSGVKITLSGPCGEFQLDQTDKPMVCIAGGSGMSAILALVEHAQDIQVNRDCYFYYGARTQCDLYCQELIKIVENFWNKSHVFKFIPVLSEEPLESNWNGERGLVTDIVSRDEAQASRSMLKSASAFLCGPLPMVEAADSMLRTAGTPGANIYKDIFEDARSPAPIIDNSKCVLCDECLLVKPVSGCIVETSGFLADQKESPADFKSLQPSLTSGLYYNSLYIDSSQCIRCYACVNACPHTAISPSHSLNGTLRQPFMK